MKVKDADVDRPISFKLDVMPVFMRAGCNQGSCHGAARGKDGFRLSLFGFDPDGDHYRLTREMNGRRINLALPPRACCSKRRTGKVPHTGGQRIKEGDEYYQTLLRWLEAGAPHDPADHAHAGRRRTVSRRSAVLDGKGATQQMVVRAQYSDGTDRDVTTLALFLSNNDTSAKISPDGLVTAGDRGEAFVMARFATFTVGAQVIVAAQGVAVHLPASARKQLHRHAGRRQAQEAAHRPVGALHRRSLPAPGLPRHHRHAADAGGIPAVHDQHRAEQARAAGR